LEKIKAQNIPLVTLAAGDRVRYTENQIDFLSPDGNWIQSGELNDTGFVELVKAPAFRALLTADTGFNIEDYLVNKNIDIRADVLKVGHHGSKYSSGDAFLAAINPKVAVIEVGENNRYGHPTQETLARLAASVAKVFRTDQNGNIEIFAENGKLKVFAEK
jgi:competence protein ComEC